MITEPIASGVIDVHAHWLPRELFGLPPGSPFGAMHDREGQLYLGDTPLSIDASAMSDVPAILGDMARNNIGVRVLSAPPFAFPMQAADSETYVDNFNNALADVVAASDGALVGLGMVPIGDPDAAIAQMKKLASVPGIAGVAIPPLLGHDSLDRGPLRHVLATAAQLQLSVLVHPMQLPRPEWSDHYLANLIGNPVETATAVASLILGGVKDELPDLRICFVHGGGCSADLLGRWTHGWRSRPDVRRCSSRSPTEAFSELYFDTVTHDAGALRLLMKHAADDHIVCGSDYPFDMAESDPVGFAAAHGPGSASLTSAARAFLGL